MNIAMLLQMAADTCGDRVALTFEGEHQTYADLFAKAQSAAAVFKQSNAKYVSVLDTSSPAVPIALMGAAMAGLPYVPLNYRLTRAELNALITRISPVYLVADQANFEAYADDVTVTTQHRADFLTQVALEMETPEWPDDPSQIAVQLFTSGTTGAPKAAILRHEHLVSYILGSVDFMSAEEDEATLVSVPPYHIAGISAIISSLYACRRIAQLADFEASRWLSLAESERITNAFVVPTMLTRVIEHIEQHDLTPDLSALRAVAYGGGKMPGPVIEKALELFSHIGFTNAYGLTETSSTVALLGPEDHRAAITSSDPAVRQRLTSVGQPLPAIEIEIRNEEGQPLPAGDAGEIYVRGPQVSGEYLERNALDDDGWFPTRDAGFLDDAGFLYLSGRADDVIVRGGENISPAEIEDVLIRQDAIADAAVLAVPSQQWGEAVAAAVVLNKGASVTTEALQNAVKAQLRSSRVPEQIVYLQELPYNETGKLLRRLLKVHFD